MQPYAIIETGGKQYMVRAGDRLDVEKLDAEAGASVTVNSVLAVSDGSGLTVGMPLVSGAAVDLDVVEQFRGRKVLSFKKKRRKGYHKTIGHRQSLTAVKVSAIRAG
jgi:large subunit ribosomal protein L21